MEVKVEVSKDSEVFYRFAEIANRRRKNFDTYRMNLAEFGFGLQLAYAVGVTVKGLEILEANIMQNHPSFSGWNLSDEEEFRKTLRFLDELRADPSRNFEQEWVEDLAIAKDYLKSLN